MSFRWGIGLRARRKLEGAVVLLAAVFLAERGGSDQREIEGA